MPLPDDLNVREILARSARYRDYVREFDDKQVREALLSLAAELEERVRQLAVEVAAAAQPSNG